MSLPSTKTCSEYHLLSTTRRDPQCSNLPWFSNAGAASSYLLLSYHCDRLIDAARLHGWILPNGLTSPMLEKLCDAALLSTVADLDGCYRMRLLLSDAGALSVTATPIAPLPTSDPMVASTWLPSMATPEPPSFRSQLLEIHPDTVPTPSSLFTRTKTTRRDYYTAARERFAIPAPPTSSLVEVLLYNEDGDYTETSIRNIAFVRRSPPQWITPAASTGCLTGVARRWLLEQGRIAEANVGELKKDDILDGEYVLTFNGVEGCRVGRISLHGR